MIIRPGQEEEGEMSGNVGKCSLKNGVQIGMAVKSVTVRQEGERENTREPTRRPGWIDIINKSKRKQGKKRGEEKKRKKEKEKRNPLSPKR